MAVELAVDRGVAVITITEPPVNALSANVTRGLGEKLDTADADPNVRAIVLTGGGGNFIAGADVTRLERIASGKPLDDASSRAPRLPDLIARLENGPKPTVAAIDGFALGGGLELALGCAARVGTARARIGLPELQLGLIPGAGGTQRLPRLTGVRAAIELMLSSRQAKAAEAEKLGVFDAIAPEAELIERAQEIALELADGKRLRTSALTRTDRLEDVERIERILAEARVGASRKFRNVTHPFACLDAVAHGIEHGPEAGLEKERELFLAALETDAARGLIHLFFAERAAAKVPGVTDAGLTPKPMKRVAVIGGGTMGSGIATALLDAGLDVIVKEASTELAERARGRIQKNIDRSVEKGRLDAERARATMARLSMTSEASGLDGADIVIEAATENRELKQRIFAELAAITPQTTTLASNTSTIDIRVMEAAAGSPERVVGTHFFSPAHVMKLVEIVRTEKTSPQTLVDVLGLSKRIKKTAVTVGSCAGFLVNRVFMPYGQITGFLIDRGTDPYRIDSALFSFGMPMGPCRMSDLAGIDVGVAAGAILDAAYPDRSYRSALRRLLVEAGRLGEKSGRGHYRYDATGAAEDPELQAFVARAREIAGSPTPIGIDDDEIAEIVLFGVVNEACRAIEEGVVLRAGDVDVAAVLGMGFPAYRGGPMKWADRFGAKRVEATLRDWHERFELGLFRPSEYLVERARSGRSLLA